MPSALTSRDEQKKEYDAADDRESDAVCTDEFISMIGDENTRRVLEAIAEKPRGGREIAEMLSLSRPTVYRRLNDLTNAELAETTMAVCPDGHHHKQYTAALKTANLKLTANGLTATVERTESSNNDGDGGRSDDWSLRDD